MRARGFTLLELMIGLAVSAILMTIAVPTYADFSARHRLAAATETLSLQLREARYEAVQRKATVFVTPKGGADWCVAVSLQAGCTCDGGGGGTACAIKTIDSRDFAGVSMTVGNAVSLEPRNGHGSGELLAVLTAGKRFGTEILLTPLGRPKVCATGAPMSGLTAC